MRLVGELARARCRRVGSVIPPTGNQPSFTEKKVSSSIPSQNSGIE